MPRPTIYLMEPQHDYLPGGPTCYRRVVLTSSDHVMSVCYVNHGLLGGSVSIPHTSAAVR
jgi:hypothetical protein